MGQVRIEAHSGDGVIMVHNLGPEARAALEHRAQEAGVSVEDFMLGMIDAKFRHHAEERAREQGVSVEQYLEQLDQEADPDAEQNEILRALELSLGGGES